MDSICKDCKYFRQHYIKFRKNYEEVFCGHCVHPRLKDRKPNTPSCARFQEVKEKNN